MRISLQLPAKGQSLHPSDGSFHVFGNVRLAATDYAVLNGAAPYRHQEGCWLDLQKDVLDKMPPSMKKDELLERDIFGRLGVDNVKPTHRNPSVAPMLVFSGDFKDKNLIRYAGTPKLQNLDIYYDRIYPEMLVTEFGTYPQSIVEDYVERHLNRDFRLGKLVQSNAVYTIDGAQGNEPFKPIHNKAYVADGDLYVRTVATKNNSDKLLNGKEIITGRGYWCKVEPVRWMMEKEDDTQWISQFGLLSGLQFDCNDDYKGDNLKITTIYKFMQEYMLPEMLQGWDFEDYKQIYEERMKTEEEKRIKDEIRAAENNVSGLKQKLSKIWSK